MFVRCRRVYRVSVCLRQTTKLRRETTSRATLRQAGVVQDVNSAPAIVLPLPGGNLNQLRGTGRSTVLSLRFDRSLLVLIAACIAILLGWLLLQPMPALQDFGEWIFQGWAVGHLLHGDTLLSSQFFIRAFPVPNMFSQALLTATIALLGPFGGARLTILFYFAAGITVAYRAARTFAPTAMAPLFVLLMSVVVCNACFWHGYMSYQFGLLGLLWYFEWSAHRRPSPLAVFAFSLLLYTCHASVLIAFVLWVLVRERERPDYARVVLALAPACALFAVYLTMHTRGHGGANNPVSSLAAFVAYKGYTLAKAGPFHNLVGPDGRSAAVTAVLYRMGVVLNVAFAGTLLAGTFVGVRHLLRMQPARKTLLPFWIAMLLLFALMPSDFAEVVNLGERFLYVLLCSLLLLTPPSRWKSALATMCLAGFALTLAQLPRVSLYAGAASPEAYHRPPEESGRAYAGDGLFSHRLYQNDERRTELRDHAQTFAPLLFDTWMLQARKSETAQR